MTDDWRPVPESRGRYSINRAGDVRNNATGQLLPVRTIGPENRPYVYLPGHLGTKSIARLLAMTFLPHPNYRSRHVHHKNGDPTDNRLENLEWLTPSEHAQAHVEMGTRPRGERHHFATLTTEQVREIRRRAAKGEEPKVLANELKASFAAVSAIVAGRTWKHVT